MELDSYQIDRIAEEMEGGTVEGELSIIKNPGANEITVRGWWEKINWKQIAKELNAAIDLLKKQANPEPERELVLDGNRGIHIPKNFYDGFDFNRFGLKKEDYKDLASPKNELYWETWDDLLENAVTVEGYKLEQDEGDLWLVKYQSRIVGFDQAEIDKQVHIAQVIFEDSWS